jgi:hypothetical protein
MSNNLMLPPLIVGAAYVWYRTGFPRPAIWRRLGWSPEATLVAAGSLIILVLVAYSIGELWLGAVQVSRDLTVDYYVYRTENSFVYWSQLALQLTLGFATGGALIALGRQSRRSSAAGSSRGPA